MDIELIIKMLIAAGLLVGTLLNLRVCYISYKKRKQNQKTTMEENKRRMDAEIEEQLQEYLNS